MRADLCVTIPQGKLVGKEIISTYTRDTYYGFCGIPYAKPPIKQLRFKPPQPADSWAGILDATKDGNDCVQYSFFTNKVVGSEDCLYTNVYTPEPPCQITSPKAVIVLVHLGGNSWGSGSADSLGCPDFFMNRDIIYVAFNFRLSVFGFLNLGLPECPGNMGLKDQVMLLQWVKNNIKYFGGDPNNVTLVGSSTGSANINFHMMSPMSKGLFHKAVMQSGYALNAVWSYQDSPFQRALELGQMLGFQGRNPKLLLEFIKKRTGEELVKIVGLLRHINKEKNEAKFEVCLFLPSVETIEEGAFLIKSPRELMDSMEPIPVIMSLNEREGVAAFCANVLQMAKKKLGKIVKENLWMYNMNGDTLVAVTKQIRSFYFNDKKVDVAMCEQLINLYTDMWFCEWNNMMDSLSTHPSRPPVYVYQFTFDGAYNFSKRFFMPIVPDIIESTGAIHADDCSYMTLYKMYFDEVDGKIEFKERERKVIDNMISFLTSFAKTGNPNSSATSEVLWRPFDPENPVHLRFDENLEIIDNRINPERVAFWNELIKYIKNNENVKKGKSSVQDSAGTAIYGKENAMLSSR